MDFLAESVALIICKPSQTKGWAAQILCAGVNMSADCSIAPPFLQVYRTPSIFGDQKKHVFNRKGHN